VIDGAVLGTEVGTVLGHTIANDVGFNERLSDSCKVEATVGESLRSEEGLMD